MTVAVEAALAQLDEALRRAARTQLWIGLGLAGGLGVPLQVLVWTSQHDSFTSQLWAALLFAPFTLVLGGLMMWPRRRFTERLRRAPGDLTALSLRWIGNDQGQLLFGFGDGKRFSVKLPAETARAIHQTLAPRGSRN